MKGHFRPLVIYDVVTNAPTTGVPGFEPNLIVCLLVYRSLQIAVRPMTGTAVSRIPSGHAAWSAFVFGVTLCLAGSGSVTGGAIRVGNDNRVGRDNEDGDDASNDELL